MSEHLSKLALGIILYFQFGGVAAIWCAVFFTILLIVGFLH